MAPYAPFVRAGVEAQRRVGERHQRRVLDALVRASGGVREVTAAAVRDATRQRGMSLSIATVRRHLAALEVAGRVHGSGGRGPRGKRWRPSFVPIPDPKPAGAT